VEKTDKSDMMIEFDSVWPEAKFAKSRAKKRKG